MLKKDLKIFSLPQNLNENSLEKYLFSSFVPKEKIIENIKISNSVIENSDFSSVIFKYCNK